MIANVTENIKVHIYMIASIQISFLYIPCKQINENTRKNCKKKNLDKMIECTTINDKKQIK